MNRPLKVYLAAPYGDKDLMNQWKKDLEAMGIEVTSRWLDEPHSANTTLKDDLKSMYADFDVEDVDRADILIFKSYPETTLIPRGGRHVEFGYAMGKKPIYVVGPKENIFHYRKNARIRHFKDWESLKCIVNAYIWVLRDEE